MEMKWNPIVNGDLSEVPRDEDIIFTVFDKNTKEVYTARGIINDCMLGYGYVCVGLMDFPIEVANIKAWMELPEPYNPKANSIRVFLTDDEQNEVFKKMKETGKMVEY